MASYEPFELVLTCSVDDAIDWLAGRTIGALIPLRDEVAEPLALSAMARFSGPQLGDASDRLLSIHDSRRVFAEMAAISEALRKISILYGDYLDAFEGDGGRFYSRNEDGVIAINIGAASEFVLLKRSTDGIDPGLISFEVVRLGLGSPLKIIVRIRQSLRARRIAIALAAASGSVTGPTAAITAATPPIAQASAIVAGPGAGFFAVKNIADLSAVLGGTGVMVSGGAYVVSRFYDDREREAEETKRAIYAELARGEFGVLQRCLRDVGFYDGHILSGFEDGYTRAGARDYMRQRGLSPDLSYGDPLFVDRLVREVTGLAP